MLPIGSQTQCINAPADPPTTCANHGRRCRLFTVHSVSQVRPVPCPPRPSTARQRATSSPPRPTARSHLHGRRRSLHRPSWTTASGRSGLVPTFNASVRRCLYARLRPARRNAAVARDARPLGGHVSWDRASAQRAGCRWGTVGGGSTRPEGRLTGGCRMTSHPAGRVCRVVVNPSL